MGKKTTTPTKTATSAKAATPAKPTAKPTVKKQPAKAKPAAAKPTKPKPKAPAKPVAAKAPGFTQDDIALRAYYIGEKRRHLGLRGDESHDWIEAERQLLAESKPARRKPASK
jgi:outer membrane biosynthesis protein TonB